MSLKQQKDLPRHPLRFVIASLSVQIMRQVEHHPRGTETLKKTPKKSFFFKTIRNHALDEIETNGHSESTGRPEFAIKDSSSAFPNLPHGMLKAKRIRAQFAEKPKNLTPRMLLTSDCCGHFLDVATEIDGYFREPGLYEVDEHFEKTG